MVRKNCLPTFFQTYFLFFARRRTFATVFVYKCSKQVFTYLTETCIVLSFWWPRLFFVLRNGRRKQMIKDRFSFVFFKSHSPSPISNHHVQCQGLTQRLSKTVSKGTQGGIYSTYVCTFSVFMGLVDYSHCTLGNSEPKICKNLCDYLFC